MSVYDEMRAALAMDLKPNELKVWMTYRLEMDEETRQVRGKTQDQLRALCGLSKSQFSTASGSLIERGMIGTERSPNAASTVFVLVPDSWNSEIRNNRNSELGAPEIRNSEIRNNRNSELGAPEIRNSEVPKSGTPLYIGSSKSTPESAKGVCGRANANEFWANAIGHGAYHHDGGVRMDGDRIELANGTRIRWLERFNGDETRLELALIQAAAFVQPNSSRPLSAQVEGQLARIAGQRDDQNARYEANRQSKPSAGGQPKRTLADALRDAEAREAAACR